LEEMDQLLAEDFPPAPVAADAGYGDTTEFREPRPHEWLLIEWPEDEAEPTKYWLSKVPRTSSSPNSSPSLRSAGTSSGTIRR